MSLSKRSARPLCARSEKLEDRIYFAAHTSAPDPGEQAELNTLSLSAGTEIAGLREMYALDGLGQTVAIIDSGVAFDHPALGGGYGTDYRVVGGHDFAEPNDPAPYDDGPAGLHGTHVAGIIGSSDDSTSGIAPGVDLVALRIFDDQGKSEIDWLEGALQWVHTHKDSFESPITTVNLSVGFDSSVDKQRLLQIEDELRTLYNDGIFVAVAAGNEFSTLAPMQLSYPASSMHVVPVASVDSNNLVSSFSQRNATVLAAPGENITSTAPDHIDDFNGKADDFYSATGSSMAAPYVAGASVLVREAMQRAGFSTITQETIYNHLRDTADMTTDPVTGVTIASVNIERAIGSILHSTPEAQTPDVDNGQNQEFTDIVDLGAIEFETIDASAGESHLRVTASRSGTVTILAEDGRSEIQLFDASTNELRAESNRGRIDLSVSAGESMIVRINAETSQTIRIANVVTQTGHSLVVSGTDRADAIEIDGDDLRVNGIDYEIGKNIRSVKLDGSPGRDMLTVANAVGDVNLRTRGLELTEPTRSISTGRFEQISVTQSKSHRTGTATLTGTSGNDIVGVTSERLTFRGGRFQFTAEGFGEYEVDANGGQRDRIRFVGTEGNDRVVGSQGRIDFSTPDFAAVATGFNQITVDGGGSGADVAQLTGTDQTDFVYATPDLVRFSSLGNSVFLGGFRDVSVDGGGGTDSARIIGSENDDHLRYEVDSFELSGQNFRIGGNAFDSIAVYGRSGSDRSTIEATPDRDEFRLTPSSVQMDGGGVYVVAHQFELNTVEASRQGTDVVFLEDSSGDDTLIANDKFVRMSGDGFHHVARGFAEVFATAKNGGDDRASLFDSAGDDTLFRSGDDAVLSGQGFSNRVSGFERVLVRASRGVDQIYLNDDGPCQVEGESSRLKIAGANAETSMTGFDAVLAELDSSANVEVENVDYVFTVVTR